MSDDGLDWEETPYFGGITPETIRKMTVMPHGLDRLAQEVFLSSVVGEFAVEAVEARFRTFSVYVIRPMTVYAGNARSTDTLVVYSINMPLQTVAVGDTLMVVASRRTDDRLVMAYDGTVVFDVSGTVRDVLGRPVSAYRPSVSAGVGSPIPPISREQIRIHVSAAIGDANVINSDEVQVR